MKSTCYITTGFYQQTFKAFVENTDLNATPIYLFFKYQLFATSFYQEYIQLSIKSLVISEVWMKVFHVSEMSHPPLLEHELLLSHFHQERLLKSIR